MTISDPITEQLSAANPVPSVTFLVPTVNDANEFLAIVKGLDLADDATRPTGLPRNIVASSPRERWAVTQMPRTS